MKFKASDLTGLYQAVTAPMSNLIGGLLPSKQTPGTMNPIIIGGGLIALVLLLVILLQKK